MLCSVSRADGTHEATMEINHGVDGWVLTDMDWDPDSGVAVYDYVQSKGGKYVASACAIVMQPCTSDHEGWSELWQKPSYTFTL